MKVYRAELINFGTLDTTVISEEIELDLPRGFIAKIKKLIIQWLVEDTTLSTETATFEAVFVRDPDDITTIAIPEHTVDHDVLMSSRMGVQSVLATSGATTRKTVQRDILEFDQSLDIVTARNMRMNATGDSSNTDWDVELNGYVYYTLEAITKQGTLEILDIL